MMIKCSSITAVNVAIPGFFPSSYALTGSKQQRLKERQARISPTAEPRNRENI